MMATQLTDPEFIAPGSTRPLTWTDYGWVYLFAATIGFSTPIAEPALIAVSLKANEVSGGALNPWGLRIAVAIGVAFAVALGYLRALASELMTAAPSGASSTVMTTATPLARSILIAWPPLMM